MFVANNWALLGGMTFILVSTMYPKISELWGESATVGPPHFNRWMGPIGLIIFALMGLAPLFGWRKTSGESIKKAFRAPLIALARHRRAALGGRRLPRLSVLRPARRVLSGRRRRAAAEGRLLPTGHHDRAVRLQRGGDRARVRARRARAPGGRGQARRGRVGARRAVPTGREESPSLRRLYRAFGHRFDVHRLHRHRLEHRSRDRDGARTELSHRRVRLEVRGLAPLPGQPEVQRRRASRHREDDDLRRHRGHALRQARRPRAPRKVHLSRRHPMVRPRKWP